MDDLELFRLENVSGCAQNDLSRSAISSAETDSNLEGKSSESFTGAVTDEKNDLSNGSIGSDDSTYRLDDKLNLTAEKTSSEKTMTTKEIAEQLGTKPAIITENAKRCLPNKVIKNGKPTYYTVEEVTVLLDYMKKHQGNHSSDNLSFQTIGAETELTPALMIKQGMDLAIKGYQMELARLKVENAEQRQVIADQRKSLDVIANSDGLKSVGEVGKVLGIGRDTLFALLRQKKILFLDNGVNLPYQCFIDAGYFRPKVEQFLRNGVVCSYTRVYITPKGLVWLERRLREEED